MAVDEIRCRIELAEDRERQGPGRLVGRLLTYGERASDRPERFEAGALKWPHNGIVLRRQHDRGQPIMRVIPETRASEVVIDAPLPDTRAGRDTAAEIRGGLFVGLSIEFRSTGEQFRGGERVIKSALLTGAGLVDQPSYTSSLVEVRERGHEDRPIWL